MHPITFSGNARHGAEMIINVPKNPEASNTAKLLATKTFSTATSAQERMAAGLPEYQTIVSYGQVDRLPVEEQIRLAIEGNSIETWAQINTGLIAPPDKGYLERAQALDKKGEDVSGLPVPTRPLADALERARKKGLDMVGVGTNKDYKTERMFDSWINVDGVDPNVIPLIFLELSKYKALNGSLPKGDLFEAFPALKERAGKANAAMLASNEEVEANSSEMNGGIDLTAGSMNLQTQNANGEINFRLDPAMLQRLQNSAGFTPVILNMQPMRDPRMFLGLKEQENPPVGI